MNRILFSDALGFSGGLPIFVHFGGFLKAFSPDLLQILWGAVKVIWSFRESLIFCFLFLTFFTPQRRKQFSGELPLHYGTGTWLSLLATAWGRVKHCRHAAYKQTGTARVSHTYVRVFSSSKLQLLLPMKSTEPALLSVLTLTCQRQPLYHLESKGYQRCDALLLGSTKCSMFSS